MRPAAAASGGKQDRLPPEVVFTRPEQLSVDTGYTKPVVFTFDERISERGLGRSSVVVSPLSGEVELDHSGDEVKVSLKSGWKPGQIYHVVLLPGLHDLFGNQRKVPAELVFSTGPSIPQTALAGLLTDRITGKPQADAWVLARAGADSTTYAAVTDTAGFYALRFLPPGSYVVTAFADRNNNRKPDVSEALAVDTVRLASERDTVLLPTLALLVADTAPARLVRAEAKDTTAVHLFFDDYLDPTQSLAGVHTTLLRMPDSTRVPGAPLLYFPKQYERMKAAQARAAADTAKGRPPGADTAAAAVAAKPPAPARAAGDTAAADTVQLPTRELVLVPSSPFTPHTRYVVQVQGVVNVNELGRGAGSVAFETPARPKPPPPDTTRARAPGDTTGRAPAPDTGGARRPPADTARAKPVPADTSRPPPADTMRRPVPPDTSGAPPAAAAWP